MRTWFAALSEGQDEVPLHRALMDPRYEIIEDIILIGRRRLCGIRRLEWINWDDGPTNWGRRTRVADDLRRGLFFLRVFSLFGDVRRGGRGVLERTGCAAAAMDRHGAAGLHHAHLQRGAERFDVAACGDS